MQLRTGYNRGFMLAFAELMWYDKIKMQGER